MIVNVKSTVVLGNRLRAGSRSTMAQHLMPLSSARPADPGVALLVTPADRAFYGIVHDHFETVRARCRSAPDAADSFQNESLGSTGRCSRGGRGSGGPDCPDTSMHLDGCEPGWRNWQRLGT
jgi:hypothetical protein